MVDVREVIAEAIPCNIVYGRPQAADEIIDALHAAGFRILGPDEVDPVTVEKCAEVTEMYVSMGWRGTEITEAIRAIGRKA